MRNLSSRQREILQRLTQKGDLAVEEIQAELGISQATAYREIQELTQMGLAAKIPGGIGRKETSLSHCIQCGRENNLRTNFLIEKNDGQRFAACCSHCGLLTLSRQTDVSVAMTTDFIYGTMVNVKQAWYVLNSKINLCCRPSLLSFSDLGDAQRFKQGFEGEVLDYASAQKKIQEMMAFVSIQAL